MEANPSHDTQRTFLRGPTDYQLYCLQADCSEWQLSGPCRAWLESEPAFERCDQRVTCLTKHLRGVTTRATILPIAQ